MSRTHELDDAAIELLRLLRDPENEEFDLVITKKDGRFRVRMTIERATGEYAVIAGLGQCLGEGRDFVEAWEDSSLEELRRPLTDEEKEALQRSAGPLHAGPPPEIRRKLFRVIPGDK